MAEGLIADHAKKKGYFDLLKIQSAGTSNWHVGDPPHLKSIKAAGMLGADISAQRCRQIEMADIFENDLILGMDRENLHQIEQMKEMAIANADHAGIGQNLKTAETGLFLDYAGIDFRDVPDPWGGLDRDYDEVAELIQSAAPAILKRFMEI